MTRYPIRCVHCGACLHLALCVLRGVGYLDVRAWATTPGVWSECTTCAAWEAYLHDKEETEGL